MNDESAAEKDGNPTNEALSEQAAKKAKAASEAKADELRTALESKGEQGKSSLGFVPSDEE
ncbi:MAG: hypothetical protein JO069_12675 [Verrucomicrobia bacterium]|nr:hypothetical protein [Verrucomicrobiota bacterium]